LADDLNTQYIQDVLAARGMGYPIASEKHRIEECMRRFGILATREAVDEAEKKQRQQGSALKSWVNYVEVVAASKQRQAVASTKTAIHNEPTAPTIYACRECEDSGWVAYDDKAAKRKRAARCVCAAGERLAATGVKSIKEIKA
jgi:hypothetical protein